MLHAVIMAGGAGTRFWPASRISRPKQLLALAGQSSMIEDTVERLRGLVPADRTLVVTNRNLVAPIRELLSGLPSEAVIGEPCKRDTAPCIGLAAILLQREDPDATLLVMPSDHVIRDRAAFQSAVRQAVRLVDEVPGRIVTFGIRPTYPAESFGYIERDQPLADAGGLAAFEVRKFREKPSAEVARQFLAAGTFCWNSGIFVWKAATILRSLERFEPIMHARLQTIAHALGSPQFGEILEREFTAIEGKSIDFAVLERHPEVIVIEAPFDWDDVGNWQSLARLNGTDAQGNTSLGRHLGIDTQATIVRSEDDHLIVTLGMHNCIVVHTPDATLVANRDSEEAVRRIAELLKDRGWEQYL